MVGFFLNTAEGFAADDLPNLHAWVRRDPGQTPDLHSITRLNGRWIAGGRDGTVVTSSDGFSWSEAQVGIAGDTFEIHQTGSAVYLMNPGYCDGGPCGERAYRSEDGISWTLVTDLPAELKPVADLPRPFEPSGPPVRAGERWLLRAHVGSVNTGAIFALEAGGAWTPVLINEYEFNSVSGRNGLFLAGDIHGTIHVSNDLQTWTSVHLPSGSAVSSVLVDDRFVLAAARGASGGVYTSVDGLDWELLSITNRPIYGGAEIDGAFWFVGESGLIVEVDPRKPAPLVNLSVRAAGENPDSSNIIGFVVEGEGPREMLIRVIGPGLEDFGVSDVMDAPQLEVWSGRTLLESAGAWNDQLNADAIKAAADQIGAFALDPNAEDAALLLTLYPGVYSALAYGRHNSSGQRLIEVYDVTDPGTHSSSLTNSSDRGQISAENPLVGGFVVRGDRDRRMLIRAIGPGLQTFDVAAPATDPALRIWRDGEMVAACDDWVDGADISQASLSVGAFDLATGSKDAALVFQAAPGAYTVHVTASEGSDGGEALLEVYYLDL